MRWVLVFAVASFAIYCVRTARPAPYDDTDPPGGRSGITLFTDDLTGCQYLGSPFGPTTPRLGADGKQICIVLRK